jgi:FtsP/CotA-like multicopper oxidase with cupredoxin domain
MRGERSETMRRNLLYLILGISLVVLVFGIRAEADVDVQCPGDINGDAVPESPDPNVACMHIAGGDGFTTMADGRIQYIFGFSDVTGIPPDQVLSTGRLNAQSPAPLIKAKEGQDFYLTLTTLPMKGRPDLFDPHTVHWHGFPNAAPIFDGEPMASIAANPGASLTYYYQVPGPGTYMYHCHVEATEHMQMGMLGNLYVTPLQDDLAPGTDLNGFTHQAGFTYVFNDGDGSTYYQKEHFLQIIGFDPNFHDANEGIQPLPFADMVDTYMMINGRGYPNTINPAINLGASPQNNNKPSQKVPSLVTATRPQKLLLRISNLSTVHFSTITIPGITMRVVGKDAMILRGTTGQNLYYETSTLTLGGGQSVDVIIDTSTVQAGTYFLHTTKLDELSNNQEDFGGLMTEIVIN